MNEVDDINYEDLDDLALSDHVEWNHTQSQEFCLEAMDIEYIC